MNKIITILLIMIGLPLFAQKYDYKIKLDGVTNMGEAKMATDYLRDLFEVYPSFNDSTDYFEFKADLSINKTDFEHTMTINGYIVLFFTKEILAVKEK